MRGHKRYPIENHYYTEREKLEDRCHRQKNLQIPSREETAAFLGDPPTLEDLPDWLTRLEEKQEKLEGFCSQIPHELLCNPIEKSDILCGEKNYCEIYGKNGSLYSLAHKDFGENGLARDHPS